MYKIILVDDEPWALKGLSEIIPWDEYGFEICGRCKNTEEALAVFRRHDADALITDIRMPGPNGLELIAAVKKIKSGVECVMVSAYSDFEAARRALEYQASAYILKPLEEEEVKKTAVRIKANLDNYAGNIHSLLINDGESLKRLSSRIERMMKSTWRYAVLYSGEIPLVAADWTEINIGGVSIRAAFFSVPEKTDFSDVPDQAAFSRRREGCENALEMLREASLSGCGGFAWTNHPIISEIQHDIARHYMDDFSLDGLALRFSVSGNYLGELFKKHAGKTIVNFVRTVRMENAGRLLKYTDLSLKEAAWECGYPDVSYFGRSFKSYFGLTPVQFRHASDFRYRRPNFFVPWLRRKD